jgi:ketosteroid isomerase-like protein
VTDRTTVSRWLAGYETAWRSPGTDGLAALFTADAVYIQSPYRDPVSGLAAISRMWDAERDGPDEVFTISAEIVAVDGPTAVVRAQVQYADPVSQEYRDLWVLRLGDDGRCSWFEEWPFSPPGRAGEGTPEQGAAAGTSPVSRNTGCAAASAAKRRSGSPGRASK